MDSEHDYYAILGVARDATDAEIRRAFRALAKEHHPDIRQAGGKSEAEPRDFRLISEAYETLKDSSRRADYDREFADAQQVQAPRARPGKRVVAVGLCAGVLLAVAVGAGGYLLHGIRLNSGKTQDSLKNVAASENASDAGQNMSPARQAGQEAAAPAAKPDHAKALPSLASSQAVANALPSLAAAPGQQGNRQAPDPSGEPAAAKQREHHNFEPVIYAPDEPVEFATGPSLHRKTIRAVPGKGVTQSFTDCASCPEMVVIPAGEAFIGARPVSAAAHPEEGPAHRIHLEKPFAVSKGVISAANWQSCVDAGACRLSLTSLLASGPHVAATRISWADAKAYVKWLSQATGWRYRLPTEAEWEYAVRAGKARAPVEKDSGGRYAASLPRDSNGLVPSVRFGRFAAAGPNAWGLHGGGVFEWVEDCWHGAYQNAPDDASPWLAGGDCSYRVVRGSTDPSGGLGWRPSARFKEFGETKSPTLGFRVARDIPTPAKPVLEGVEIARRQP